MIRHLVRVSKIAVPLKMLISLTTKEMLLEFSLFSIQITIKSYVFGNVPNASFTTLSIVLEHERGTNLESSIIVLTTCRIC